MWGRSRPSLHPPAKALFYVVLSVLRFGILTVKHSKVWDRSKYRSSFRTDSHKASDWEYRNRAVIRMLLRKRLFGSLYMIRFDASLYYHASLYIMRFGASLYYHALSYIMRFPTSIYIMRLVHDYISCIIIHHAIWWIAKYHASLYYIIHHYIWCDVVHHYIIMHHCISCVFVHQYISCVWCMTIYHASLYIMPFGGSQYISCVWCITILSCITIDHAIWCITKYHASLYYTIHHYIWCVLVHHCISCITIYMIRFGMVGRKCNIASLLRELVFVAGVKKYFGAIRSTSIAKIYIRIWLLDRISQTETV